LWNYGTILGTNLHASGINAGFAADLIVNGASAATGALIAGWLNGIDQFSSAGTIINFGTVESSNGDGVYLQAGGTVTNQAGGLITGSATGVHVGGGAGTVSNSGTIIGTGTNGIGVDFNGGGTVTNSGIRKG